MTHPENNFFRTFEIEFSSKNRHFWLVIKFHTLLKNYHFVQKSKVFGKRNKLFEIKFPTKVVILKNCRFDTKKRVLAWISLKYIFFIKNHNFWSTIRFLRKIAILIRKKYIFGGNEVLFLIFTHVWISSVLYIFQCTHVDIQSQA